MNIKNLFYPLLLIVMIAITITACNSIEGEETVGQTSTFQVSINVGPAQTRAISVGGNNGHTLYTSWDQNDAVEVVKDGVSVGTLNADVSAGNSAYATLMGTLTGTFAVGNELALYYHSADIDYTGQKGTIADVSTCKSFLTATSTVQKINQADGTMKDGSDNFLVMSNASYSAMQAYLDISFTDNDGDELAITQLDIWTDGGKLVKTAPLDGEKTYATQDNPLIVTPDAATGRFFLALRDEAGSSNTYNFKATSTTNDTYFYSQNLNLAIGGYYYAASPKAMMNLRVKPIITRGDGGLVPDHNIYHCFEFNPNGSNPIDATLIGTSYGYNYIFNGTSTVHLNNLQAEFSDWSGVIIQGDGGDLTLDITGDNAVISINNAPQSIAVYPDYNLYLRGNGRLTVGGKNMSRCGLRGKNYLDGGEPSVLAADGYIVTRSEPTFVDETDDNLDHYTWTYTVAPEGSLLGKFTVNASGYQVYFSKGNLQASTSDLGASWQWAFATHQWDYVGGVSTNPIYDEGGTTNNKINGNGTVSTNGVVDLFSWVGESSTWTGAAMFGITNSTNIGKIDGFGNNGSENLKSDWGNTIGTCWRTLTSNEWAYLLNTRASGATVNGTSNARYTHATINTDDGNGGVNGIILFPDGVTIAADEATSWGSINNLSNYGTKCTTAQWAAFEAKHCVFLPAAGLRAASNRVYDAGTIGSYWSSSPVTSVSYSAFYAYQLNFYSGGLVPERSVSRDEGNSVRLVCDAY